MPKITKSLNHNYPIKNKVVRNLRTVVEIIGELKCVGTASLNPAVSKLDPYNRYSVDLEAIYYEGVNVLPLLSKWDITVEIEEWLYEKMPSHFSTEEEELLDRVHHSTKGGVI